MKITDFVIGAFSIGLGILAIIKKEFWPMVIPIIVSGITIIYFSDYISKIAKNELEIKKLKEKLIIYERLNRLELEVFKK